MSRTDHVHEDLMIAAALRELTAAEERRVRNHAARCKECAALLDAYSHSVELVRAGRDTVPPALLQQGRSRLQTLLDRQISYEFVDVGPLGKLLVGVSARGLCYVAFVDEKEGESLRRLARTVPGCPLVRSPDRTAEVRRQVERYLRGELRTFDLPLDLSSVGSAFQRRVLQTTAQIPFGERETYSGLARRLGRPKAARAVGGALNRNPVCIVVPCHRVVARDGSLRGYRWGIWRKERLLQLERASASQPPGQ